MVKVCDCGFSVSFMVRGEKCFDLGILDISRFGVEIEGATNEDVWYFNRINVSYDMRGKGVGRELMNSMIEYVKERKISLVCEINPYGEMDYNQLKRFYMSCGFEDVGDYLILNG